VSSYQKLILQQRHDAVAAKLSQRGGAISGAPVLCINCESYSAAYEFTYGKFQHRCHEPLLRDPVTGWPTDAAMNRKSGIGCGPNGSFYRAKPPTPQREIDVTPDASEPMEYVPPVPVRMLECRPADEDEPACIRYRRKVHEEGRDI
jgi:hypothetical protein